MGLPNLEKGGWEPGMYWAADSPEQQKELDIRYKAEGLAAKVEGIRDRHNSDVRSPYDREETITRMMNFLIANENYQARPLKIILRDTLSWLDVIKDDSDRYNTRHTTEREAASLLHRVNKHKAETTEVDSELLAMAVRWSALEYFMYNYWRDWDAGTTREECLKSITGAGVPVNELDDLLQKPKDDEAESILHSQEGIYTYGSNLLAFEAQMLRRAKEVGFEFGKVDSYGQYLQSWGV